jgi:hypothetical protein
MQSFNLGSWLFELPDGFLLKRTEDMLGFFENEDRSVSVTVSHFRLGEPQQSARHFAELMQRLFLQEFHETVKCNWKTGELQISDDGELVRSTVDLYAESDDYRIISLVVTTSQSSIRLTIHDYGCTDYIASKSRFSNLETFIKGPTSEA